MKPHAFINVVIPFDSALSEAVNAVIRSFEKPDFGNYPKEEIDRKLAQVKGLHFMTLTVAEPACPSEIDGDPTDAAATVAGEPSHLLIEISSDEGSEGLLADLAAQFQQELLDLLRAAGVPQSTSQLLPFLLKHRLVIGDTWGSTLGQTFTGSPGLRVERIIGEAQLAERIGRAIDDQRQHHHNAWEALSPRQRLDLIRAILWEDTTQNWKWAFVPDPAPCLGASPDDTRSVFNPQIWKVAATIFHKLFWPLYVPFLLIVLFAFVYAWRHDNLMVALMWTAYVTWGLAITLVAVLYAMLLRLRYLERTDPVEDRPPSTKHGDDLLAMENFGGQNHLASVSRLKPGLLRRLTLRLAFIVVGTGRFVNAPGFLGKNGVIHFARWMRLPKTNQLLFLSNYDDTWESYVADFIADAPTGVTGIWSNCVGFPRTRALFGGGAADRDRLVRWARRQQHPTYFWYSAYRDLTAARIRINAGIRQAFATAESDQDCGDWLALFGSAPRPADSLQLQEIPTLAFGGLSFLRHSACVVITLSNKIDDCKAFLHGLEERACYGEADPGRNIALVVGISSSGLEKVGVPLESVETFPVAFKQGMSTQPRARELGDTGDSDPAKWKWGVPGKDADVFILVYALHENAFNAMLQKIHDDAAGLGHLPIFTQPLTKLRDKAKPPEDDCGIAPAKEPFGFTDGVSQPIIRGAPRSNTRRIPNHIVEAGEFILGYPDNLGVIPPSPTIPDVRDPLHMLPDAGPDPFRKRPESSSYEGHGRRDLGMNGTFLVVRQLKQDVTAFDTWFAAAFEQLKKTRGSIVADPPPRPELLATPPVHIKLRGVDATGPEIPEARSVADQGIPFAQGAPGLFPLPSPIDPIIIPELPRLREIIDSIKEVVTAKLIGRWTDGASLVRHSRPPVPDADPPRQPDNEFLLGEEDPTALACPFGAHIRRANPRDTRFPGSSEEIASTNRHRLLRVGRVFGRLGPEPDYCRRLDPDPANEKGLLFMCLNSDIERQFEFVQKTWLLNPSIHGLRNEVDPIIGHGPKTFTIPTTTGPLCLTGIPDFVTVMGGGYFFLPSRTVLRFLATSNEPAPEFRSTG